MIWYPVICLEPISNEILCFLVKKKEQYADCKSPCPYINRTKLKNQTSKTIFHVYHQANGINPLFFLECIIILCIKHKFRMRGNACFTLKSNHTAVLNVSKSKLIRRKDVV